MLVILDYANGSVNIFNTSFPKEHEISEDDLKKIYPEYKESQCSWMYKDGDTIDVIFNGCNYEEE